MVTSLDQSNDENEEPLVVTYLKGFTSRPIVVPTIYAIRFFCGELEAALNTLAQSHELMDLLGTREEEKKEIKQSLQRIRKLYDEFLMNDLRK
ncbi:MAG: hypothetical protein ACW98Y_10285 [Candidatus Thorarchaeota archaeon]